MFRTAGFALIGRGDYRRRPGTPSPGAARSRASGRNHFMFGRMTNTLAWLRQEYGDFAGRARAETARAATIGHRIKNGNVEISALIDLGFNDLGAERAPARRRALRGDARARAAEAFGAHRWRWSIHLAFGLTHCAA